MQAPPKTQCRGPRGRPTGSKHRHRREVESSPSLGFIQEPLKRVLEQLGDALQGVSFIFAGALGHNDARHMLRHGGRHVVSKLRSNSARYFPDAGPYAGRGPRRQYGQQLASRHLASEPWKATSLDKAIETRMYQMSLWHKKFADLLTIVVSVKTHVTTPTTAHVVLLSRDVT